MSCEHEAHEGQCGISHLLPRPPPRPFSPSPRPGAWLTLPECTLAPRSLSHSKLLVPNTKLLPLAKEENIKKREDDGGEGGDRAKGEVKSSLLPSPQLVA